MKKILFTVAAVAMMLAGCTKGFDERLTKLEGRVDALEEFVTNLNEIVGGISNTVAKLDAGVYVTGVEPLENTGTVTGYRITFNQGNPIVIKHGSTGAQGLTGENGKTPTIDMYTDGNWYWKYRGSDEWMLDSEGKMIPAHNSLRFEIHDGHLWVSIDGSPLIDLGEVKGDKGEQGEKGDKGDQGEKGETGATGPQGPQGEKGEQGETGATGPQGPQGEKGETGATGPQGEKGDKGDPGEKGETGATGPQGEKGDKGDKGDQGEKGDKGDHGDSWFDSVIVDEEAGTVTISIVGSDHDLVLPFVAAEKKEFALNLNLPASTEVVLSGTINIGYTLVGCDAKDVAVFVQAPEDWTVELNESAQRVSLTVGEKAGRVVVYAINNVTGEVRAKFVAYDPETMLIVNVEKSAFYLLPDGSGSIEIPVSTGLSYRVEKSDWLTVAEAPATKAMTHKVYTVTAGENTTGNTRDGEVNFWTSDGSKLLYTVTVSQNGYNPALLVDGEGNPIKWQETFKLLAGGSEKASYKNDFTFALSDDFSKGTYKITNMFYATSFHDANMQLMTNQGGEYYADLEDGILTVYRANSNKSYGFTSDVKVAWDSANNTFSIADPINVGYITGMGNNVMLSEYAAKIKVDEPAGAADWSSLYGVYNESTSAPHASSKETLVISESDNSDYDLKMLFFYTEGESSYSYDTAYGKVAADGKSITVTVPNNSNFAGPVSDFVLNVDGNTISGSYAGLCEYSASKPAGFDASVLYGEYWETFSGYPTPGTTVIEASDKSGYDLKITFFKPMYGSNCDVVYGKVNSDGTVITIDGFTSNFFGPCSSFTINVDGTNLSGNYAGSLAYTAVKK